MLYCDEKTRREWLRDATLRDIEERMDELEAENGRLRYALEQAGQDEVRAGLARDDAEALCARLLRAAKALREALSFAYEEAAFDPIYWRETAAAACNWAESARNGESPVDDACAVADEEAYARMCDATADALDVLAEEDDDAL